MALVDAYNRVTDLQQLVATLPAAAPAEETTAPATTATPTFASQLTAALPTAAPAPVTAPTEDAHNDGCCCCCCSGATTAAAATPASAQVAALAGSDPTGSAGQRALAVAETQLGQAEQPPGSND